MKVFQPLYSLFYTLTACLLIGINVSPGYAAATKGAKDDIAFLKDLNAKVKLVNQKCTPATIAIISPVGSTGSGVVVSKDGLILTAAHVIQGTDKVSIVFPDGRMEEAQVLGANYTRDSAMVKLDKPGPWPHVAMGNSDDLKVGDYVVAMGHAKGFDPNRRPPIRFGRLVADAKQRFMMSECTLIGGDSGGPLFNTKGEVIGIHSSIGPNVSINNHVPLSAFRADWKRLLKGEQWGELGLHPMADPESPVLGFSMLGTEPAVGIVVDEIIPGSPANKAGLNRGDLITHIDGRTVNSPRELIRELERFKPTETAELHLVRKGQQYKTPITFGRRGDIRIIER